MRKLKRKSDGLCFDCSIVYGSEGIIAVYWDDVDAKWHHASIIEFTPAIPVIDY